MRGNPAVQHRQQYAHPTLQAGRPNYCLPCGLLDGSPFCIVPVPIERLRSTGLAGSSMTRSHRHVYFDHRNPVSDFLGGRNEF